MGTNPPVIRHALPAANVLSADNHESASGRTRARIYFKHLRCLL